MELIVNIIRLLWLLLAYVSYLIFFILSDIIKFIFLKKDTDKKTKKDLNEFDQHTWEVDIETPVTNKISVKNKPKTNNISNLPSRKNTKVFQKPKHNTTQRTHNNAKTEEPTIEELRELFPENYGDTYKSTSSQIVSFLKREGIYKFYHFTDVRNLQSIILNGGLYSWYGLNKKNINSFTSSNELSRNLDLYHGLKDYVRLSYKNYHPMSTKVQYKEGKELIWLEIDIRVATIEGTLFSNINATDNNMRRGNDLNFIRNLNLNVFEKKYNQLTSLEKKQYQAEILVKSFIPLKYILNIDALKRRYL